MLSVPLFHLAGIQVSLTTLLSGGRAVFLTGKFDPGEVLRLIETERVRVWGSIPTMVSRVLDHPEFGAYDTSSVSSVPMGGAAVSAELRARVSEQFTGVKSRVGSLYGLTEAGGVLAAGVGPTSQPGRGRWAMLFPWSSWQSATPARTEPGDNGPDPHHDRRLPGRS